MTKLAPNPHSPYANADPDTRHIFLSPIFFPDPTPGGLALTACEAMAVVPEQLAETHPGVELPEGLCPDCVTVMNDGRRPARPSSECGECGSATWHGELCALCRQEKHEAWWPTRPGAPRTHTPDEITVDADGRKTTKIKVKRACNGCGTLLGDADDRDVDDHGNLTDVRAECPFCRPIVEFERTGCTTWHLTERNIARIAHEIDQLRPWVFTKGYWQTVDGKLQVVGLRIGQRPDHIVARFGDWIIHDPRNGWSVHKAPASSS